MARLDHGEDDQAEAQLGAVDDHGVVADDSGFLKRLEPAPAGILRQSHPVGDGALRLRGIMLKFAQDPEIQSVPFFAHIDIV